jgi:hypothetical protein
MRISRICIAAQQNRNKGAELNLPQEIEAFSPFFTARLSPFLPFIPFIDIAGIRIVGRANGNGHGSRFCLELGRHRNRATVCISG